MDVKVLPRTTSQDTAAIQEKVRGIGRISIVILYFILFAAALTAGIAAFRIGLDSNIWPSLCALAALAFTLAVPAALLSIYTADQSALELILGPAIAFTLVVYLGLSFFGITGLVVMTGSTVVAVTRLAWFARQVPRHSYCLTGIGFLVVFILYFVGLAGTRYGSLVADLLALGGRASADVYYHWSITNALRFYGKVAIGVDGLLDIKYYPMVHLVAARIAVMSGS